MGSLNSKSKTCSPGKDGYKLQVNKTFKNGFLLSEEASRKAALTRCTSAKERCKGVVEWDYEEEKKNKSIYLVQGHSEKKPSDELITWKGACLYSKRLKEDESQDPLKPYYILGAVFGCVMFLLFIIYIRKKM